MREKILRADGKTVDNSYEEAQQQDLENLARRTILVDDSGNLINSSNPLPVDTEITLSGNVIVQDVDINNISAGTQTNDVKITLDGEGITATNLDIRDLTSVSDSVEVKQATGTNLHTVLDSGTLTSITNTIQVQSNSVNLATESTLSTLNTKFTTGTDIGDVTINNSSGASAVNIQDGGNSITVDGTINSSTDVYIQRIEYDSNGFVIYVGLAVPGSAESSLVWQIKKFTNNSMGQSTAINFADSNTNFDNRWDQKDTYSYG